jgi:hypothetical protein
MYKYSVKIRKVSGRLNESVLPNKSLVIKSKGRISKNKAFMMVENYLKNKYGLTLHEAEIINEGFFGNLFGKNKQAQQSQQSQQPQQSQIAISEFPTLVNYNDGTRKKSVIFPDYMYDERTSLNINGTEEWTIGAVNRLLPNGMGAFITSLDSNFAKEFNVAKQWADNLSASLQKATPQDINNVLKQAISFANMTEYIQTVEEEVGNLFDRIDNIKNLNRGVHQQGLSNANKKIVNAISMFLKGIESIAEQKNANNQIINTIYTMVQRIMRHYTIAKLMNSAVSRETDNGGALLGQIYYALSK